ncbi:MAG: phosphoenolpyruvate synthase [Parasphingopyxis sp.]|uniref:phosphoenolpyruvate synthase n=1 Tax=Parasphingopyxis sp. TaxID=1920299 RepID=UPI003FA01241
MTAALVREFSEIGLADIAEVGGKNASLGEMIGALGEKGVSVPQGFATTTEAYRLFVDGNGLAPMIAETLAELGSPSGSKLEKSARAIREAILAAPMPDPVAAAIREAYAGLEAQYGRDVAVAVRSSATAEDLPQASFAGQHDSFLNISGADDVVRAVQRCFASLYTARAISYRADHGLADLKIALSAGVQKMVRADQASSGVVFTLDTESGFRDVVMVTGVWGLGEAIVQGLAEPDEFHVHKPTLRAGYRYVLRRRIGAKECRMVYARRAGGDRTELRRTTHAQRERPCLSDAEIVELAEQALTVEAHYSAAMGADTPMDIEWAKDGPDGELFIIQARPETVHARAEQRLQQYRLTGTGRVMAEGQAVGNAVACGIVRPVASTADLEKVGDGDVLVSKATSPDWEPVLKRAAAIVTESGGRTCHAAIVARELGVPAVVGVTDALDRLKDGDRVTISCAEGRTGRIYRGAVPFEVDEVDLKELPKPLVKLMVNVGNPDIAFQSARLPVDGVGLARSEFIMAEAVRVHPMALIRPERTTGKRTRQRIDKLVAPYGDGADYFIAKFAEGVGTIAAAFYPRPVIVRTSDFKSNEYAALLGGKDFEPAEENPMIGFRGAARYAHPAYQEAFALECRALRHVRETMGLTNLIVMIPFCRRLEEARQVLEIMAGHGLKRGENGLQIYMMTEIPSNVILVDDFARHFDGFSIGSNDLTQLTLGIDRDSDLLAEGFDERDPAVEKLIMMAIEGAHQHGRSCGICGQRPSDDPAFAAWLVEQGIDSISVTPDSVLAVLRQFEDRN